MRKQIAVISVLLTLLFSLFFASVASAASPSISRSYETTSSIPTGSLVSLITSKSSYIEEANNSNSQRLVGVAVGEKQSLIAVNPSTSTNTVQVATSGEVNALVSTVNGYIVSGEQVAASPFNGVGMKAGSGDRTIGTALTSFNNSTPGATVEKVADSSGSKHTVIVGYVKLSISIGTVNSESGTLQRLQNFIEGFTGHPTTILRIIISLVVAFVAILSIVSLIYASIYGSIISIGRNPLAKSAIFRTLTSVVGMVTLIAGVACATIYFLLY